jgi:hypothetical protein
LCGVGDEGADAVAQRVTRRVTRDSRSC